MLCPFAPVRQIVRKHFALNFLVVLANVALLLCALQALFSFHQIEISYFVTTVDRAAKWIAGVDLTLPPLQWAAK